MATHIGRDKRGPVARVVGGIGVLTVRGLLVVALTTMLAISRLMPGLWSKDTTVHST